MPCSHFDALLALKCASLCSDASDHGDRGMFCQFGPVHSRNGMQGNSVTVRGFLSMLCRTGVCPNGKEGCPHSHPPQAVTPCGAYAVHGRCSNQACTLQHRVAPELMPLCVFYFQVQDRPLPRHCDGHALPSARCAHAMLWVCCLCISTWTVLMKRANWHALCETGASARGVLALSVLCFALPCLAID